MTTKRMNIVSLVMIVMGICLIGYSSAVKAQSVVIAPPQLTQLSPTEFVDLSKVRFLRLPIYTPPVPGCNDCQNRWGATILLEGVPSSFDYSEAAEARLKEIFGVK